MISTRFVKDMRWKNLGLYVKFKKNPKIFLYCCRMNDLISRHYFTFEQRFTNGFSFTEVLKDLEQELGKATVNTLLNLELQEDINALSDACIEAYQYCQTHGWGHNYQIDSMAYNLEKLISLGYVAFDKTLHPELACLQNRALITEILT